MIALLTEFLPYILTGIAAIAGFLGVKRHYEGKGREKERVKWEAAQAENRRQQDELIDEAREARLRVEYSDYDDLMRDDGYKLPKGGNPPR